SSKICGVCGNSCWSAHGNGLLDNPRLVDAVWIALQHQRARPEMRQDPGRDASVVVDQITLPDTVTREQDFLWPCNLHFLPVDSNNFSVFRHFISPVLPL